MSGRRARVAILGGGLGALTAALELSREPGLEIVVYTLGWHLGGKGASHRDARGRIVEHGLHVWFGFYEHAFRMIRAVYGALDRPADHPLARWEQAFLPGDLVVVHGERPWPLDFPRNGRLPGDPWLTSPADLLHALARWTRTTLTMAIRTAEPSSPREMIGRALLAPMASTAHLLDALVLSPVSERAAHLPGIGRAAAELRGALRQELGRRSARSEDGRRLWVTLDLALTVLYGFVRDDLLRRGLGAIDGEELRGWLERHGATRETLESPALRASYIAGFAYAGGDLGRPECAAGALLSGLLRVLLTYQGAYYWRMSAGMGETIFTPLYELLLRRGVRFEWFSHVLELIPAEDGRTLDAVQITRQARTLPGYQPLAEVRGLACWRAEPDWEHLEGGEQLRAAGAQALLSSEAGALGEPLELRAGRDFDALVLGIPVGVLPRICGRLAEQKPAWHAALSTARTCATASVQLWTRGDLGWPRPCRSPEPPLYGGAIGPVDTWADMSHLVAAEGQGPQGPDGVHYLCGPWAETGADPEGERLALEARITAFLERQADGLWPGFRWESLDDPEGRVGPARLRAQVLRVNQDPSDRYVLTPPGTVEHRLAPDGSGYDNLFLCGDWTRNGVNLGCIEATVVSGEQAARACMRALSR